MGKREIPNANTNGFDKNPQNINRKGRPKKLDIKADIERVLQSESGIYTFTWDRLKKPIEGVSFGVEMPNSMKLIFEYLELKDKTKSDTIKKDILEFLIKMFGGNPTQKIEVEDTTDRKKYDFSKFTNEQMKQFHELLSICEVKDE